MTLTTLELSLISPERIAFQREVGMVILPGADGQFGVLPQHMNLIAEIMPGKVEIRDGGSSQYFYVSSGVAHVSSTQCSVLALDIVDAAEVDTSDLYARQTKLTKELANSDSESEKADLQAELDFINMIMQDLQTA